MKKLISLAACSCVIACLFVWTRAAVGTDRSSEILHFKLGDDWKDARHSDTRKAHTITYIREGDDVNEWKEMVDYTSGVRKHGDLSPEKEAAAVKKFMEKKWPGALQFNVLARTDSSILYEWQTPWSARTHEQHGLMRIMHGKDKWFDLSYVAKVHDLAPDTRAQWIKILSDATIATDDRNATPAP